MRAAETAAARVAAGLEAARAAGSAAEKEGWRGVGSTAAERAEGTEPHGGAVVRTGTRAAREAAARAAAHLVVARAAAEMVKGSAAAEMATRRGRQTRLKDSAGGEGGGLEVASGRRLERESIESRSSGDWRVLNTWMSWMRAIFSHTSRVALFRAQPEVFQNTLKHCFRGLVF